MHNTIDQAPGGPAPRAATLLAAMERIVGPRWVVTDGQELAPWLTDWRGRYTGRALAMVAPADAGELAGILAVCAAHDTPVVTQGGNSGMVGGATPDASGTQVLLSTRRLVQLEIDANGRAAHCGAGVVLQTLHEAADGAGLRFPLSLGGKGSATIGGLVSTNAGGTQVLRHGTMRALVQGLEVVLADGRLLDVGGALRKDNRGFDLKQLFIGSEGTLGVVTRAVLRLVPAVRERQTAWVGLNDLHAARRLLLHCQQRLGDVLEGFEVLPQVCLDHVVAYLPGARAPLTGRHQWHALIEWMDDGRIPPGALRRSVEDCLHAGLQAGMFAEAVLASSEAQADAFWALRENIAAAEKARGPAVQHDIAVPPGAMPAMVEHLTAKVDQHFPGQAVRAFGHLGDGNIHFHVAAPAPAPTNWQEGQASAISALVYDEVVRYGGTISAEHGIGQDKLATFARTHDPVALDVLRAVKAALDPAALLNPGKLVPLARDAANP